MVPDANQISVIMHAAMTSIQAIWYDAWDEVNRIKLRHIADAIAHPATYAQGLMALISMPVRKR